MKLPQLGVLQAIFRWAQPPTTAPTNATTITSSSTSPVRILTHNIRYAATSLFPNERPWSERKPLLLNELSYQTRFLDGADPGRGGSGSGSGSFICLQEALHHQLSDILAGLNNLPMSNIDDGKKLPDGPTWAHIGVGRDDGKTKGEYSPILFPVQVFELLHFESKWLSPTPDVPSRGWDAGSIRVFTVGVFEHRQTGKRVLASNTHLDNEGAVAREKSVVVILETIDDVRRRWAVADEGLQYFIAGDFNSKPDQEAYRAMKGSGKVVDAYDAVPEGQHFGDVFTFTGFEPDTDDDEDGLKRIDFVWLGPKDTVSNASTPTSMHGWDVQGYSVVPNVFDKGIYCSDHRAVVVDALLGF